MTTSPDAGAVIHAKDLARVSRFCEQVAGLRVTHAEDDHVVLVSGAFPWVLVAVPQRLAASIELTAPPRLREDTAIMLVLVVTELAATRDAATRDMAPSLGGQLQPAAREWGFQGMRVCDGHDPEGQVVQFRERRG